ncbi:MAG: aspartyl protease family protein [Hyphomonadaceae bacterium]|nr:aspartyl protease family protein [Hyphomonadaceae bacterium]
MKAATIATSSGVEGMRIAEPAAAPDVGEVTRFMCHGARLECQHKQRRFAAADSGRMVERERSVDMRRMWIEACAGLAAAFFLFAAGDVVAAERAHEPVLYAAPTTNDGIGRILAPVWLNGQGPFLFIVDTGANRTVLAPETARRLGLDFSAGEPAVVHGVTGSELAPMARVAELRIGAIVRRNVDMPVLTSRVHATADGMLGADNLTGTRISVDFRRNRIDISDSRAAPARPQRATSLPAEMRFGLLPLVRGRVADVQVEAVVDTGAERSIGNSALRAALIAQRTRTRADGQTLVFGAVGPHVSADIIWVPRLRIGAGNVTKMPLLFADTHVFRIWRLEEKPALLLGMDVIGQLDAITIDYRLNRVWFLAKGADGITARVSAEGASRMTQE